VVDGGIVDTRASFVILQNDAPFWAKKIFTSYFGKKISDNFIGLLKSYDYMDMQPKALYHFIMARVPNVPERTGLVESFVPSLMYGSKTGSVHLDEKALRTLRTSYQKVYKHK
jgi:hypothetical protein